MKVLAYLYKSFVNLLTSFSRNCTQPEGFLPQKEPGHSNYRYILVDYKAESLCLFFDKPYNFLFCMSNYDVRIELLFVLEFLCHKSLT